MHDSRQDVSVDQAVWSRSGLNHEPWEDSDPGDCNSPTANLPLEAQQDEPKEKQEMAPAVKG